MFTLTIKIPYKRLIGWDNRGLPIYVDDFMTQTICGVSLEECRHRAKMMNIDTRLGKKNRDILSVMGRGIKV